MDEREQEARLIANARFLSFFALVKHLSRLYPDAPAVGHLGPVAAEAIRFRHDPQPIFHASDVAAIRALNSGGRRTIEITTTFLGVVGSVSPLANFFTEALLRTEDDASLRDFYDLFHHRLLSLFFRAQLRGAPVSALRTRGGDAFTARAMAVVGVRNRVVEGAVLTPRAWLGLGRVLSRRPRGRDALEAALLLAFPKMPVRVIDFLARDLPLAIAQRAQLGRQNVQLGRGARLGHHLLRQTGLLRLSVGPVNRETFDSLLPGARGYARLRGVVDTLVGGLLDADVEIEIACGEEPRARLGSRFGTRLGATALIARPRVSAPFRARVPLMGDAAERAPRPAFLAESPP